MIRVQTNEKGMVSITVTVVIMLVISITVLSFAQIIRREQRQALDSQLSSQAFYAAESGINQTRKYVEETWISKGQIPKDKTECGATEFYPATALPMDIDGNAGVRFSCLLVTGNPKSLKYDLSPSAVSKVFPIDTAGTAMNAVDLSWTPARKDNPRGSCPTSSIAPDDLPKAGDDSWRCGYGMIRIDLVPTSDMSRSGMMQNMFTAFITPSTVGGTRSVNYQLMGADTNAHNTNVNQGARPVASCTDETCKITITGLSGSKYYARVSTIYQKTSLSVVAKNGTEELSLMGAQVLLDATGRAQDVLRRVQVRVPLVGGDLHPDYGVQSNDSLCKTLVTANRSVPACSD